MSKPAKTSKPQTELDTRFKKKITGKKGLRHAVALFVDNDLNVLSDLSQSGIAPEHDRLTAKSAEDVENTNNSLQLWLREYAVSSAFKAGFNEFLVISQLPKHLSAKKIDALVMIGVGNGQIDDATSDEHRTTSLSFTQLQKLASNLYKTTCSSMGKLSVMIDGVLNPSEFGIFSLALMNAGYSFDIYKSKKNDSALQLIDIISTDDALKDNFALAHATHVGQSAARNLANHPANVCTPSFIADEAKALAKAYPKSLKLTVLDHKQMQKLGMNCFLAVAKGSENEGKLVILEYTGGQKTDAPVALVGKGITFDTGGISIKPAAGMEEMKFDMGGAASVFGTMRALCEANLPINVVGAMACAENMPSSKATRPGDVVTAMDGQTVEILNTDAEGRLVLCDTLTYIKRYNPVYTVDMATLTGACLIAIGSVMSGLFSQDEVLAQKLLDAGKSAHDRAWRLPLDDDYQDMLDSPIADMQNIGGRPAGAVTAACFLSRFTKGMRWAHLDIAGSAWVSGKTRSATGRPVPLLMQFLSDLTAAKCDDSA